MVKIYHNPRCRKSREGLALLETSGKPFDVVRYLDNPITETELKDLLNMLGISPIQLVRQQEAVWKSEFRGKDLSDQAIINALLQYPKLMERPIVVYNGKAVIGRPPQAISELLD